MESFQLCRTSIAHLAIVRFDFHMLKVTFVLATLLTAEGAHPIIVARGYEPPEIVPRAVPGKIQPRALEYVITLSNIWFQWLTVVGA